MSIACRTAVSSNKFDTSWERVSDEGMVLWGEMSVMWVWIARAWMVLEREMIWGSIEGTAANADSWF